MNLRPTLIGAIIGDMIGSFYSSENANEIDFRNLPDMLTATQDTLIVTEIAEICRSFSDVEDESYKTIMAIWMPYGRRKDPEWPNCRYSEEYIKWCNQFSNDDTSIKYRYSLDSAILLRTIPIAFYYKTPDLVLQKAELLSSWTSYDSSEVNSAKALALAIHLAYTGLGKEAMALEIYKYLGDECMSSFGLPYNPVEMSIKAFMDSTDFESAIRNAISFSQNKFNLATITGALAAAYYSAVPEDVAYHVRTKMSYRLQRIELDFFRKLRKYDFIKVSEPPKTCPLCGSPVVRIRYGLVSDIKCIYKSYWGFTPEPVLEKDRENERLSIIGGCVVYGNDPKWGCVGCEVKFNDVERTYSDDLIKELQKLQKQS